MQYTELLQQPAAGMDCSEMTPVLQPTDTTFALRLKRFQFEASMHVKQVRKAAEIQAGVRSVGHHYGALEILEIAHRALEKLHRAEAE